MTITLTREEAQQVLDALENFCEHGAILKPIEVRDLLRARLAQPEPEPVAYGVLDDNGQIDWTAEYPFSNEPGWPDSVPLYTAPLQREWQGLTDEEIDAIGRNEWVGWPSYDGEFTKIYRVLEDKLKEKNDLATTKS
jgi:hypothetical protein